MTLEFDKILNIALFASGQGTNVDNILKFSKEEELNLEFKVIVTDNADAPVKQFSEKYQIPLEVLEFNHNSKKEYELELLRILEKYNIDWLFLCGFMRIFGKVILDRFFDEELKQCKIINVHPSYLPEFPGINAYERAFDSEHKSSGVSIHFVDRGIDTGKIITQERFPKENSDDFDKFKRRGQQLEYNLYRKVVKKVSDYQRGVSLWTN